MDLPHTWVKFSGWLRLWPADCEGLSVSTRVLSVLDRVCVTILEEAQISWWSQEGRGHNHSYHLKVCRVRVRGSLFGNISCASNMRHTLGLTVWTEMGRDNRSPAIYLTPRSPRPHAAVVSQCSPLKIMSQSHSSDPETLKKITTGLAAHLSQCVTRYNLMDLSLTAQLPLKPDTAGLKTHTVPHRATCMRQSNGNTSNITLWSEALTYEKMNSLNKTVPR